MSRSKGISALQITDRLLVEGGTSISYDDAHKQLGAGLSRVDLTLTHSQFNDIDRDSQTIITFTKSALIISAGLFITYDDSPSGTARGGSVYIKENYEDMSINNDISIDGGTNCTIPITLNSNQIKEGVSLYLTASETGIMSSGSVTITIIYLEI